MHTAVVLPARNEEQVIAKMVTMILAVYGKWVSRIIVVDDASTDRTAAIVRNLARTDRRVVLIARSLPGGAGRALRDGLAAVPKTCDWILTLDADFIRNIPDLFDFFRGTRGIDGLIGSRYLKPHSLVRYPLFKKICNRLFHLAVRLMFNIEHHDLTNNFKLYRRTVYQSLPLTESNFAVNAETGIYPVILGYRIRELPVTWYARDDTMGESKFRLLSVATSYLRVIRKAMDLRRSMNLNSSMN